jgi:succinate dehydrogenase/fumarate reductase cytochrome b subunit
MKELQLRKLHRVAGVVLAPFLVLQALSGVLLSVDWLLGIHHRVGESVRGTVPALARIWDAALVEIHYGAGVGGAVYHILLGVAVVVLAASGIGIYLQVRARLRR